MLGSRDRMANRTDQYLPSWNVPSSSIYDYEINNHDMMNPLMKLGQMSRRARKRCCGSA